MTHPEGRPPSDGFDDGGVEGGEVDEGVGGQEEVGDERRDGVELGDDDTAQGDEEGEDVAAQRFLVLAEALGEPLEAREELVLAQRLEHFGRRDKAGQRRAERGREAAGVDQRPEGRHQFDDLEAVLRAPLAAAGAVGERAVEIVLDAARGGAQHAGAADDGEAHVRDRCQQDGQQSPLRDRHLRVLNHTHFEISSKQNRWRSLCLEPAPAVDLPLLLLLLPLLQK